MSAPERQHALLSASGSLKWLHCPPSARLEESLPENTSEYAEEGRLAHEIAELKLRNAFIEPMGKRKFNNALKKLQARSNYDVEMLHCTDIYLDYVQAAVHSYAHKPHVAVEKRLDYSHVAPEGFGTGDCIVVGDETLHIIDYKHGKGNAVDAANNSQMELYALGAIREYGILYPIKMVKITIVQPRINNISEWEISVEALNREAERIRPIAQQAYKGEGIFCAGEWCKKGFCRARATCRTRSETMTALEAFRGMKPPLIGNGEVGDILLRAQTLKAWVTDLEEYALSELLNDKEVPGWKAVEGTSRRKYTNQEEAFQHLIQGGYEEALLYTREPLSVAELEKQLGKKQFLETLSDFIMKPPGKPTLAPLTDKREAISNQPKAAEVFTTT